MPWTSAELPQLRSRLGESAALWARQVEIEAGRWKAFSGAFSPRYNLVLCHESGWLAETADELAASRVPAIIMAAGAALPDVQELTERGWVRAGEMPFMARELQPGATFSTDPGVRRLRAREEIAAVRSLIAEVFKLHDRLAEVALPPDAAERPGLGVWGAWDADGTLVSCVISVEVGAFAAIWSLATAPAGRRRGHATRLMSTVLDEAAAAGVRASLLYAPVEAEAFYRSLGYEVLERWQVWSRRRWGPGRSP